jgi:CHAD domain-containing protein
MTDKRIKTLSRDLGSIIAKLHDEVSPKRVHHLRTSIRRLQALIDYSRPKLSRKQQNALRDLGKLRRRAGKVRNLDIQIQLLGAVGDGSTAAGRLALQEALQDRRRRQADRLIETAQAVQHSDLPGQLRQLAKAVNASATANDELDEPLQLAQNKIVELARQYGCQPQLKPKRLHKARIAVKLIRYLAELSKGSEKQRELLQQLKSIQDVLGDWHDWEELSRTVEKQFSRSSNKVILAEVRAYLAAKHTAALSAISQLFSAYTAAPRRKQPQPASSRKLAQRA